MYRSLSVTSGRVLAVAPEMARPRDLNPVYGSVVSVAVLLVIFYSLHCFYGSIGGNGTTVASKYLAILQPCAASYNGPVT